jgi:GNAT superfamily N-acetyltransferase
MNDFFEIRRATPDDVPLIIAHRRGMFQAMGYQDADQLDAMEAGFRSWVKNKIARGEWITWITVDAATQTPAASASLWIQEWPVGPISPSGEKGHVLNVYTCPEYRRRGLARRLMQTIIQYCQEQGIPVITLHASEDGRPLYESLGFWPDNGMIKRLEHQ